ncbi:helix-turn-helix domain-containing protein [Streptacidiphilus sp. 4-A2]|nr:helix-turn-helix domain-containing protein [Streptacidiphilus sp. 4-A2]
MARWKALPAGLDPAVVEFVVQLRRLKDDSGWTLHRLAAASGYSTASWERYLYGRVLPPRKAVQALAQELGTDAERLLVRYEEAAQAWRRRPAGNSAPGRPEPDPAPGSGSCTPDGTGPGAAADTGTLPQCARLAAELRLLRGCSGLTLYELAARSAYSKSSWQRYLAGRALPPWPAVQALCRLADGPEARLRAMWESAVSAWSGRGSVHPAPPPAGAPSPQAAEVHSAARAGAVVVDRAAGAAGRSRQRPRLGGTGRLLSALACVAVVALPTGGHRTPAPAAAAPPTVRTVALQASCSGDGCDGRRPTECAGDTGTLMSMQTADGAWVEVRFSPLCRAAWARMWNDRPGDTLTLAVSGQPAQDVVAGAQDSRDYVFTPMVGLEPGQGVPMQVCLTRGDSSQCVSDPPSTVS